MQRQYAITFWIATLAYFASMPFYPYPVSFGVKAIPMLVLILAACKEINQSPMGWILTGLIFSLAGDIALDLDRVRYFIYGLGFFLVAHIAYIIAFIKDFKFQKKRIVFSVLVLSFSVVMSIMLAPNLGALSIPVFIYIAVITVMAALAVLRPGAFVSVGAVLFMLSDSMIALNKFMHPVAGASFFIICTYFAAQYLITNGMLRNQQS